MTPAAPAYLTPPEVARLLRVDVSQVHRWIRSGELVAHDLSARRGGRPRWKVSREALDTLLARRQSRPPAPITRQRRRARLPSDIVEYECIRPSVPATLEEAIEGTLPTGPGQRNRRVFEFARAVKSLCPDAEPGSLRQIVVEWHSRALPVIRTKDFRTTLQDFIVAWEAIKSAPLPMQPIIEAADQIKTPANALHYPPGVQRLVRVCAVLQQQWGDRPFFLSVRKAGEIMGCHHNSAWRTLLELQFDNVIKLETTGSIRGRRASKWRYINA